MLKNSRMGEKGVFESGPIINVFVVWGTLTIYFPQHRNDANESKA